MNNKKQSIPPTDTQMLNWLETMIVKVDIPLRYGSRHLFYTTLDLEDERSDLRSKLIEAMQKELKK